MVAIIFLRQFWSFDETQMLFAEGAKLARANLYNDIYSTPYATMYLFERILILRARKEIEIEEHRPITISSCISINQIRDRIIIPGTWSTNQCQGNKIGATSSRHVFKR